jgi:hypothetical protein
VLKGILLILPIAAYGQATRTWVSGDGDDANPCARTAPCKTFAGAISKTATGGEIDVLDPGGFGGVTITKSITIDGSGAATMAGVLVAGTNGIIVAVSAGSEVILRGLDIEGLGTGLAGVLVNSGGTVQIEDVRFDQFTSPAVQVTGSGGASNPTTVKIKNSKIRNCVGTGTAGVSADATNGPVSLVLDGVSVHNCAIGLSANAGALVNAANSNFSSNTNGVVANNGSTVTLDSSVVSLCTAGGVQSQGTGTSLRLTNTSIFDNVGAGLAASGGGAIVSFVNNRIYGNNPNGSPTTSVYQK